MVMADDRIGHLFPAGGPVPPELVIGRDGDIDEVHRRVTEGIHTMVTGERRIGKTTVCNAVCERLRQAGSTVVQIEVPESRDASGLLQQILDRSIDRSSVAARGRRAFRAAEPLIQKFLGEQGIPLDLSQIDTDRSPARTVRSILSLPTRLAVGTDAPVVFYLDEIQRVVDYEEGGQILGELVDLYSGRDEVVLLVDGSSERALERMMGAPIGFGKLVDRLPLAREISTGIWRESLPDRFGQAGLQLGSDALEALISFGEGRPYATMSAARYSALNARRLGISSVEEFDVGEGIAEARRHLEEDG
jgi:hypothetical protein